MIYVPRTRGLRRGLSSSVRFAHSALAEDEFLSGGEDFLHQFRRGGFGVNPQQALGSGGAQQHPRFGSSDTAFAVLWRVQEKLDAIEIVFTRDAIWANTIGGAGFCASDCGLLDV